MIQQGINNQMNQGVNTGQVNTIGQLNKDRTEVDTGPKQKLKHILALLAKTQMTCHPGNRDTC